MRLDVAKRFIDKWYSAGSIGQLRLARRPDGSLTVGEEQVIKLEELDEESRAHLIALAAKLNTPRFEVRCLGPNLVPDRIYCYRAFFRE